MRTSLLVWDSWSLWLYSAQDNVTPSWNNVNLTQTSGVLWYGAWQGRHKGVVDIKTTAGFEKQGLVLISSCH